MRVTSCNRHTLLMGRPSFAPDPQNRLMRFLLALIASLVLLGCHSTPAVVPFVGFSDPAALQGTAWQLVTFADSAGRIESAGARLTVTFSADGRVGGQAGPNSFGGVYSADASGRIDVRDVVTTLIGGADAERAGKYLGHLTGARAFVTRDGELRVHYADRGFLHFRRADG
jgi:heat shock protein HslJ